MLVSKGININPLFVDYGQLSAKQELVACRKVVTLLHLNKLKIVKVEGVRPSKTSNQLINTSAESAYYPNRNLLLISLASIYAFDTASTIVVIGITRAAESSSIFPDTKPHFLHSITNTLHLSCDSNLTVMAPLQDMTKEEIIQYATNVGFPWKITYSCYSGRSSPCGSCLGCRQRRDATRTLLGS
jgi:7-cyano-7-deazaguanine synthase